MNFNNLYRIHQILGEPQPGDWREAHPEMSQSVESYLQEFKQIDKRDEKIIYLLAIGEMDENQQAVLKLCREFVKVFFGVNTIILGPLSDEVVPDSARRYHLETEQLHTKFILYDILKPEIQDNALALFAITEKDLYPDKGWNYVFGQASLKDKVGVASIYRLNAGQNGALFKKRLMRTIVHELCHIVHIKHCQKYACLMNGSNSLEEADNRPTWLCPGCLYKLTWRLGYDVTERFKALQKFYVGNRFKAEADFMSKSIVLCGSN